MGRESSVLKGGKAFEWKVSTRIRESWVSNLFAFVSPSLCSFVFPFIELASRSRLCA